MNAEQTDRREIKVDPHGPVARAIADAIERRPLRAVQGDIEGMEATSEAMYPPEILNAAEQVLVDESVEDVPDDRDKFYATAIDIAVGETGTVTIEVRE